jgi:hypothetical protein
MKTEHFKVVFDEPEVEITRVVNSTFFHYGFLTMQTVTTVHLN